MSQAKKAKPSYIYAIIGISLVLFLVGTLGWLVLNGRSLSRAFKEELEVNVILHDNTRDEMSEKLRTILADQSFVRSAQIITKEAALEQFRKETGDNPSEFLDFNPLPPSIILKLHAGYVNRDSLKKISAFVMQSNIVREVTYPDMVVDKMNSNFRKIGIILGAISLVLFIVVVILIDNTVRLAMFSNRFLIKTMQMVGATRQFISRPFNRRAVWNGFISGLIAAAGVRLIIYFAELNFTELKALHEPLMIGLLMAGLIVVGILISVFSTHRSVVKYLKLPIDDLY